MSHEILLDMPWAVSKYECTHCVYAKWNSHLHSHSDLYSYYKQTA